MHGQAIERAAELLAQARLDGIRLAGLPADCRPTDLPAAYLVQDALHARLTAAGWGALGGHRSVAPHR